MLCTKPDGSKIEAVSDMCEEVVGYVPCPAYGPTQIPASLRPTAPGQIRITLVTRHNVVVRASIALIVHLINAKRPSIATSFQSTNRNTAFTIPATVAWEGRTMARAKKAASI